MGRVFRICRVWIPCGLPVTLKVLCLSDAKWLQTSYQARTSVAALHLLGFPILARLLALLGTGWRREAVSITSMPSSFFLDGEGTPQ